MSVYYQRIDVPVEGGTMVAGRWGNGGRVVIASHGITANHLSWQRVGQILVERSDGELNLVAVDHRGRAGSAELAGPFGLSRHADDLIAVLDHLGLTSAVMAGHSMGGFVVALAAERHPTRVDELLLVDGGLPFPLDLPADIDPDTLVRSVIGPALDRLDQRWPDVESYLDFFRAHPAFQPPNRWTPTVEAYVRYDAVVGADGLIRSSVNKDAVLVDGGAAVTDPDSFSAIFRIDQPSTLLWAPWGLLDQEPGLYPADSIDTAAAELTHLEVVLVEDTNHYSILIDDLGAVAVTDTVRRLSAPVQPAASSIGPGSGETYT